MNNLKKIFTYFLFFYFIFNIEGKAGKVPDSFADLAEKLMPSVVNIATTQTIKTTGNQFPFQFPPGSPFEEMFKDFQRPTERKASSLGSGFIINKSGIVVTNNHVIADAEDILVKVDSKEYKAKVIGSDPYMDLAVLKIDSTNGFTPVSFGDSNKARVGDWVIAIGNPFGLGGTVTSGIISARNRDINLTRYDDFIQTDAPINQGNSGGPLFNMDGDVIGINTAIFSPSGGSSGIGFAIPSSAASKVIDQLIKYGETRRGWLGVRIQDVTKEIAEVEGLKEPKGALVASVSEGSPADKAGLKAGDIILEFDGKEINTMRRLPKEVGNTEVGKQVIIKVWRNKKKISKKLTLGRLESSKEFKQGSKKPEIEIDTLKIKIRDINDEDIQKRNLSKKLKGVVIVQISSDSPIARALSVNDIILEVQKKAVTSSSFERSVKEIIKKGEKTLLLTIINKNNRRRYVGVKIN